MSGQMTGGKGISLAIEYDRLCKNVLITGGAGFIGSHLVDYIIENYGRQVRVIVVDSLTYCADAKNINEEAIFVCADICDETAIMNIFIKYHIDGVMHLAAESHVDRSFKDPYLFLESNTKGTLVLLECCRKLPGIIKKFLYCSTDETYGSSSDHGSVGGKVHLEDSTLLNPTNPYSASKAAAEMFVNAYIHSFKLPAVISRMNNVYGTRQYPEKVIPKFFNRISHGLLPQIQGSGHQKRTFLHTKDAASGLWTVFAKGKVGQVYHLAAQREITVRELAKRMLSIMAPKLYTEEFDNIEDRPVNDFAYEISIEKTKRELGWSPSIDFEEGLPQVIREMTVLAGNEK